MTVRLSVSLPDDLHADLLRLAAASHISAGAVVRSILSDVLPRMTSVLDYLGTMTPDEARSAGVELDAWATNLRTLVEGAPESLGPLRNLLNDPGETAAPLIEHSTVNGVRTKIERDAEGRPIRPAPGDER